MGGGSSKQKIVKLPEVSDKDVMKLRNLFIKASKENDELLSMVGHRVKRNIDRVFKNSRDLAGLEKICSAQYVDMDFRRKFKRFTSRNRNLIFFMKYFDEDLDQTFKNLFNTFKKLYCEGNKLRAFKLRNNLHKFVDAMVGNPTRVIAIKHVAKTFDKTVFR